jgi:hypothetical protein
MMVFLQLATSYSKDFGRDVVRIIRHRMVIIGQYTETNGKEKS